MIRLSDRIRLIENLDPTQYFKLEVKMSRAEIAQDVSLYTDTKIETDDRRLSDEFCEKWVRVEYNFVKNGLGEEEQKLFSSYTSSLLKANDFKPVKSVKSDDEIVDKVNKA